MKLCAAGGVVDFRAVADTLPPEIMNEWLAWDWLEQQERLKADNRAAIIAACVLALATSQPHNPDEYRCISTEIPDPDEDDDNDSETDPEAERERRIARDRAEQALFA